MTLIQTLVKHRRNRIARELLMLYGLEVHAQTPIGKNFTLQHRGMGTVIHPGAVIGDNVTIFHQVTIGRADAYVPWDESPMERIEIGDDAVLCAGAKILGGPGVTRVGAGTVIAANAVLTTSTGEWEIWGGVPAKKLGERKGNAA
ncbi:hypothetical protein [Microbacterium kunmingense]|uniref:hypothetical protein n=1 Tax=Microbacterium kunmingense TaxID=2915939 RepID=UPI003D7065DA